MHANPRSIPASAIDPLSGSPARSDLQPREVGPSYRESGNAADKAVVAGGVEPGGGAQTGRCVVEEEADIARADDVGPSRRESRDAADKAVVAGIVQPGGSAQTRSGIVKEDTALVGGYDMGPSRRESGN